MHAFLFIALALSSLGSQQQGTKTHQSQKASSPDQRGTQDSPIVVKVLPASKLQEETDRETEERKEKASNDRNLVNATYVLAAIGFLQLFVFGYQAFKLKQTVKSAGEQSEAMERHIGEAARSATAMESVAAIIQNGSAAIMRAYISVVIGGAVYQDRQDDLKFEGKPTLVNSGSTPARNVRVRIAAAIVPRADAETFSYQLTEQIAKAPAVAAPHQTYILSAIVKDFVPDDEIPAVKQGSGKALTVWGDVTYDDIFGDSHTTKFAQWLFWYPNQTVYGYYIPGQNDMD